MIIKAFFISRRTVLSLILVLFAGIVAGTIVPQRFITPERDLLSWKASHQAFMPVVRLLGLDHVYSTYWFSATLLGAIVVLAISTIDQVRAAWLRTFAPPPAAAEGPSVRLHHSLDAVLQAARHKGYRPFGKKSDRRLVKNVWGYWGNVLLHLGLLIVMVSSLIIALTYSRGDGIFIQGVAYDEPTPWMKEEKGLLANRLHSPAPLRLEGVEPEFWPNGMARQINTTVTFVPPADRKRRVTVAVSSMQSHNGVDFYQTLDFGHAFRLRITTPTGETRETILPIKHPESLDRAEYDDFSKPWLPYLLQTKYFADTERRSLMAGSQLLMLRLADGSREVGRLSLKKGEEGMLGEYRVALVDVSRWSRLVFVSITGMPGIFAGFFVIVLGSGLYYLFPPREILVRDEGATVVLQFHAAQFRELFHGEYTQLCNELKEAQS